MTDCYEVLGWTVENRVTNDAGPASETGPYVTARLYHPGKKSYGYLMFQNRDASGRPLTPPAGFSEFVRTRLADIQSWQVLTGAAKAPHVSPAYLVQLFLESPGALDPIEEEEAEALYQQVLRGLCRNDRAGETRFHSSFDERRGDSWRSSSNKVQSMTKKGRPGWLNLATDLGASCLIEGRHLVEFLPEILSRWIRSLWSSRHFLASLPALVVITLGAGLALASWQISALDLGERYLKGGDCACRRRTTPGL